MPLVTRRRLVGSRRRAGGAVLLLAGLALTACASAGPAHNAPPPATPAGTTATPSPSTSASASPSPSPSPAPVAGPVQQADAAYPTGLSVPAIDVDRSLVELGVQADGSAEVPVDYTDAGWFAGGGRPGSIGPTVLLGHVDSKAGPAVFYRLTSPPVTPSPCR